MTVNEMGFDTVDLKNRVETLKEKLNVLRASHDTMVDQINALNGICGKEMRRLILMATECLMNGRRLMAQIRQKMTQ